MSIGGFIIFLLLLSIFCIYAYSKIFIAFQYYTLAFYLFININKPHPITNTLKYM